MCGTDRLCVHVYFFPPLLKVCGSAYECVCMFVCVCVHWSEALIEQTDGMEVGGVLQSENSLSAGLLLQDKTVCAL